MRKLYIVGLIALATVIIGLAWAEQMTFSTYYPAPYGVYREMVTAHRQVIGDLDGDGDWDSDDMAVYPPGHAQAGQPIPGSLTVANRVGIGTANPQRPVHIASTLPTLILEDTAGAVDQKKRYIAAHSNGSLKVGKFSDTMVSTEHLTIDTDGNVGIGTANPSTVLHVHNGTDQCRITVSGAGEGGPTDTYCGIRFEDEIIDGRNRWAIVFKKAIGHPEEKVLQFVRNDDAGVFRGLMFIRPNGNLWIAGKLTQAGCPDYSNITPLEFIQESINKTEHVTQEEVDALMHIVIEQDEQIKKLAEQIRNKK